MNNNFDPDGLMNVFERLYKTVQHEIFVGYIEMYNQFGKLLSKDEWNLYYSETLRVFKTDAERNKIEKIKNYWDGIDFIVKDPYGIFNMSENDRINRINFLAENYRLEKIKREKELEEEKKKKKKGKNGKKKKKNA